MDQNESSISPSPDSRPISLSLDSRPISPSPDSRLISPSLESRPISPSPVREAVEAISPSPDSRPISPSPNSRHISPSPDSRPISPSPDSRPISPSPDSRHISPSLDSRSISPSPVMEAAEAVLATVEEEINVGVSVAKRKRGRPRKYDSNGNLIKPFAPPKRIGGLFISLGEGDFTPHIFTINVEEDIIGRIMSFTQNGTRGICVLSANGAVSNVQIQPLGFNDKVLTFKGAFEILSLSGSMVIAENGGVRNETARWRITIGGVDGCVFGGFVAGSLIAASPVQVVIGSYLPFIANPPKKRRYVSKSVNVTSTVPNSITSTGQVQHQETRGSDHSLNQDW